jgi:hypothetical protein
MNNGDFEPLKFFKEDKNRLLNGLFWNYNKKKSFQEGNIVIGFVKIESDNWLLFEICEITKDLDVLNGSGYEYATIKDYEKYFGRLIIRFKNDSQNLVRLASTVMQKCEVSQILDDSFDNDLFPGYKNVNLSWSDLKRVIQKDSWKTALENQKGVYLITDTKSGKFYVGKASGNKMLLGRWKSYVENGHGGNVDLKKLEFGYIKKYFRYSILEAIDDDEIILKREHWWMEILQTREFGYNNN